MNRFNPKYLNLCDCEKILNKDSNKYSEQEVKKIRDVIYNLSLIVMEFHKVSK
tara:strand:- start:301 stop:459 length:159 start_codon:yes stop_codon:yes gene_type:complete